MPDDTAKGLIQEFEKIKSDRSTFNSLCKDTADRVMPNASKEFDGPVANDVEGAENNSNLNLDATAAIAHGRHTSILDSFLTPRNSKWSKLTTTNEDLAKNRNVQLFFEQSNNVLFKQRYSPRSNFAAQNHSALHYMGAFGSGVLFIDELDEEPGLRYKQCPLGSVYYTRNHQGMVDSLWRHFKLSAKAAARRWRDKLPKKILDKANDSKGHLVEFEFLHVVKPNDEYNPLRIDERGMKYSSHYVSFEETHTISRRGYRVFPYAISMGIDVGEKYPRGPAQEALPAIRTLNEQKRTVLKQGHRIVDPIILAFDDGLADRFSLRPGAINAGGVTREGRRLVDTLPTGNLAVGQEMMEMEREDIRDMFLVTLFQILTENPQMTATEVIERVKEKGILLSPTFSAQETTYLGPMIERELDLLAFQNLLPEIPGELIEARGEYTIIYDSPFSRAQRAEEASGIMRVIEWAKVLANDMQDPSILDQFNMDVIIPQVAEIHGVPFSWMRSETEIEAIRANRQAAIERQAEANAAPGAAAMIRSMADAKQKAPEEFDAAAQAIAEAG